MINKKRSEYRGYRIASEGDGLKAHHPPKNCPTKYKAPEDFPQWEYPEFDIKKALRDIIHS